jgi:hypothetical protein
MLTLWQHLLEATKNGVYGRLPGSAGSNGGWPIEDKGVVVMLTNALSRNGYTLTYADVC